MGTVGETASPALFGHLAPSLAVPFPGFPPLLTLTDDEQAGRSPLSTPDVTSELTILPYQGYCSYEQLLRYPQGTNVSISDDTVDGLPLARFFDEGADL